MGKKEKKMRSFAGRLTRRIVLLMLIIMGLVAWLLYNATTEYAIGSEGMRQEVLLDASVNEVHRVASDVFTGASNHVPEIEECLGQPDRLPLLMERVVRLNAHIRSCGLFFRDGYYPQKGRWYCPYAVRTDSIHIETKELGGPSHDYLGAEWFDKAMKATESHWSRPFFEGNDSVPLVDCLFPIHDPSGQTVAVLSADLSLEWLSKRMQQLDWDIFSQEWVSPSEETVEKFKEKDPIFNKEEKFSKWKPYSFLITSEGTFLVHPDRQRIIHKKISDYTKTTPDTLDDYVVSQMLSGKKGFLFDQIDELPEAVKLDGRKMYVFYAPVKHTDWSMVLAIPKISVDLIGIILGLLMLLLIAVGLVVAFIVSRVVIRRAVKPLKQLSASAGEVAKGHFSTALPVIKHNDEVGVLRNSFDDMQKSLTKYVEELKATTASKAAIENELEVAHNIQMGMLPKIFPPYPDRDDIDIYGSLNPAKEVGGDLFDFYIRDDMLFFCIGDVSGKGVPASLVMAVTRTLFRNISAHTAQPGQIATALNNTLSEGNDTCMFVTLFVGILHLSDGTLSYCNAGHDQPILIGQEVRMLPCNSNVPLGVVAGWTFSAQTAHITPQTTIFLYTDGLTEAEDVGHAQFGITRVQQTAKTMVAHDDNQPKKLIESMAAAVKDFVHEAAQSDDLTMLALKYLKTNGQQR